MKIEDIFALERENVGAIQLVRDSKFWQAWEYSAFAFSKLFRPYKVNSRFFKNISAEMVYLGFPDTVLDKLKTECAEKGYVFSQVNENLYRITGIPALEGLCDWKKVFIAAQPFNKKNEAKCENEQIQVRKNIPQGKIPRKTLMLAYKEIYDYALDICMRTGKFFRNYRFGLGDRLRDETLGLLTMVQLAAQNITPLNLSTAMEILVRSRIELRLLLDLKQLNDKQWIFVNGKISRIMEILRSVSRRPTTAGESLSEFSNPLPPDTPEHSRAVRRVEKPAAPDPLDLFLSPLATIDSGCHLDL